MKINYRLEFPLARFPHILLLLSEKFPRRKVGGKQGQVRGITVVRLIIGKCLPPEVNSGQVVGRLGNRFSDKSRFQNRPWDMQSVSVFSDRIMGF